MNHTDVVLKKVTEMGKIFCIMGKSSSGKDTIYKRLLKEKSLGLCRIVPYTTRPIREDETDGVEYHFVDVDQEALFEDRGLIIEKRTYNTIHGPWDYFTVDDGSIDLSHNDYLVIGTLESYTKLADYYTKDVVVPIYIEVDDGIRLERALSRERMQAQPKYEEMCRRFLADAADFSPEKLEAAGIRDVFENVTIYDTVNNVAALIHQKQEE